MPNSSLATDPVAAQEPIAQSVAPTTADPQVVDTLADDLKTPRSETSLTTKGSQILQENSNCTPESLQTDDNSPLHASACDSDARSDQEQKDLDPTLPDTNNDHHDDDDDDDDGSQSDGPVLSETPDDDGNDSCCAARFDSPLASDPASPRLSNDLADPTKNNDDTNCEDSSCQLPTNEKHLHDADLSSPYSVLQEQDTTLADKPGNQNSSEQGSGNNTTVATGKDPVPNEPVITTGKTDHIDFWHPITNTTVELFPLPCQTGGCQFPCTSHALCRGAVSEPPATAAAVAPAPPPQATMYTANQRCDMAIFDRCWDQLQSRWDEIQSHPTDASVPRSVSASVCDQSPAARSVARSAVSSRRFSVTEPASPAPFLYATPFGCCGMTRLRDSLPSGKFWTRGKQATSEKIPDKPLSPSLTPETPKRPTATHLTPCCCNFRSVTSPGAMETENEQPNEPAGVSCTPLTWVMVEDGQEPNTARSLLPTTGPCQESQLSKLPYGELQRYHYSPTCMHSSDASGTCVSNTRPPQFRVITNPDLLVQKPHHQSASVTTHTDVSLKLSSNTLQEVNTTRWNQYPRVQHGTDETLLDFGTYSIRIHPGSETNGHNTAVAATETALSTYRSTSLPPHSSETQETLQSHGTAVTARSNATPVTEKSQWRSSGLFGCCTRGESPPASRQHSFSQGRHRLNSASTSVISRSVTLSGEKNDITASGEQASSCRPPAWVQLVTTTETAARQQPADSMSCDASAN